MEASRARTLAILLVVALAPSIGAVAALWLWPGAVGGAIYALCKVVLYGVPAVVAWKSIPRSAVRRAFENGRRALPLAFGVVSGLMIGGLIAGLWWGGLRESLDVSRLLEVIAANRLDHATRYLLAAVWLCLVNAFLEEFVFRWFVDSRLRTLGLKKWWVFVVSALIFTAHHIVVLGSYFDPIPTIVFAGGVFVGGVVWSWSNARWGSLLPGWISHALVDGAVLLVGWQMIFG